MMHAIVTLPMKAEKKKRKENIAVFYIGLMSKNCCYESFSFTGAILEWSNGNVCYLGDGGGKVIIMLLMFKY